MYYISNIREEFPLFAKKIHLDVAYKCPLSNKLVQNMNGFLVDYQMTGGDKKSWLQMLEQARVSCSRLVHSRPEEIAFIKNTSEGLNMVAWGLGLKPGDNIILNDLEHTNNMQPWLNQQRFGVEIRWVRNQDGRILPDAVKALMDDRTRVVSISAVQYKNGFRVDLKAIGEMCRLSPALFVVDAIQHLGVLPLDAPSCHIDVACCGGHKFLLGPHGIGMMYVSDACVNRITPTFVGLNSANEVVTFEGQPEAREIRFGKDARKFEYAYMNFVGVSGLIAAVDMLSEVGIDVIERHVLALNVALAERLRQHGATILSPLGDGERSAILVIKLKNPSHFEQIMVKDGIIATVRDGTLRVSFHLYNTMEDIDPLMESLFKAGELKR